MLDVAKRAAALWPLEISDLSLAAHRENVVFKVQAASGRQFALRLHRPGYRSLAELESELLWMAALSEGGMNVPQPLRAHDNRFLQAVDGQYVSLLTWIAGEPLGQSGKPLHLDEPEKIFFAIGRQMARLHLLSDHWQKPHEFVRHAWDEPGLLGEQPVWGRFWENPDLKTRELQIIMRVVSEARKLFASSQQLDSGLIHADLLRENILIDDGKITFIDFDDGGFGFRLFELATTLHRIRHEANYDVLEQSLLAGYRSLRTIDTQHLKLFVALRAFTYLGWIMPRIHETDKAARVPRLISEAVQAAEVALADLH